MKTLFAISLAIALSSISRAGADPATPPTTQAELFQTAKIWSVHLTFTPDQWEGIEPKGGPNRQFGGFGGPGAFLAPAFLKGDQDGDGKLSKEEFMALGDKWFGEWDKEKTGRLDAEELRSGVSSLLGNPAGPGFGPPPGGPGGPGFGGPPGGGDRPPGMGMNYPTVHAKLDFNGTIFEDVMVRYKGNSTYGASRDQLKRSLKIDLNDTVKGQKLGGMSKLNLHSEVTDPALMNDVLSYRLFREAGLAAPQTTYARVYLTVPGKYDNQYVGLYTVVEEVDKRFIKEHFDTKKGALFKPEARDLFADLGNDWSKYDRVYNPKEDVSDDDQQRLIEFARLVTHADDAEFAAKLGDFLDVDEFARFLSVTVWLSNLDSILSMGHNYYIYLHPKTRKFQFLPWDLDLSFGKFNMGGANTEELDIRHPWTGRNRFLERVFKVDAFGKLYLQYLAEFGTTLAQPERLTNQVNELAPILRPAVADESPEKLARFDKSVAGQTSNPTDFGNARPPGIPGFGGPPGMPDRPIKTFVVARAASVAKQLAGEPPASNNNNSFDNPNRRGGFPGPGGPGGPGPERFLAYGFMRAFGVRDGTFTRDQFLQGFAAAFHRWNDDHSGFLTVEQLRAGLGRELGPPMGK